MMKTQFTLALFAAMGMGALTVQDKQECVSFFANHGKNEKSNANFEKRCEAFAKNKARFDAMNKKPNSKAKFGCNEFCDETDTEFVRDHTGAWEPSEDGEQSNNGQENRGGRGLQTADLKPLYINWGEAGLDKVHPVKDQGRCGSCWAFSATTVQESMQAIKHDKPLARLSEQESVDCASQNGCGGGWMLNYWDFSKNEGSMMSGDYPYQASNNACRNQEQKKFPGNKIASKAASYSFAGRDPLSIAQALQEGPLSIAVQADSCWRGYRGGILTENDGCYVGDAINHAVVLIGLGETNEGVQYWTLRNSWGTNWGDNGDIHIKVTYDGLGITTMYKWPFSLQVQDGYGPQFWGRKDKCPIFESLNEFGLGKCASDEDCQGARTCSDEKTCTGESGCGDDQGADEMLAAVVSTLKMKDVVPPSPGAVWWPTVIAHASGLLDSITKLEGTLERALGEGDEPWTDLFFTTDKLGSVQHEPAIFDDIEVLKGATPDALPKIVSIEVSYNQWHVSGYKVNYAGVETERYSSHEGGIYGEKTEVFELEEGDYIVEMGVRAMWALDAFWFKTKNGREALYGNPIDGTYRTCDTSQANKPMIIGFGMRDHIEIGTFWGQAMQSLWCHVVDMDDLP